MQLPSSLKFSDCVKARVQAVGGGSRADASLEQVDEVFSLFLGQ